MKKVFGILLIVSGMFFSSLATAGGYQGGSIKVSSLRIGDDGVYIQFSPALNACNGGTQYGDHARIRHNVSQNYDAIVSSLLAAYTAGHTFSYVWFNDLPSGVTACSNSSGEILELTMVRLSTK